MEEPKNQDELPFNIGQQHYKEIAQALLTAKSAARSIDSSCQALVPLASKVTAAELGVIADTARGLAEQLAGIYSKIAAHAFQ